MAPTTTTRLLTGMYWDKPNPNFDGTYQVQCGAGLQPRRLVAAKRPGWALFRARSAGVQRGPRLHEYAGLAAGFIGNLSILTAERKDQTGSALPRVHLEYEASDIAMANDMIEDSRRDYSRSGRAACIRRPARRLRRTL